MCHYDVTMREPAWFPASGTLRGYRLAVPGDQ